MLIQQGWFTALYTQHLLNSQCLEFEICIFPREATPSHYFPLREDSSRVLAWGLHGQVRQLRYGSCHYPTAATKCNVQPSHRKPRRWKSMLIHQGWFTALYTQHLLNSQDNSNVPVVLKICVLSASLSLKYSSQLRR